MHELGIVMEVLEVVTARSEGAPVTRIVLEIGRVCAVSPDAVRFCFDLACEGTAAEGARLDIVETPGLARCRGCDGRVALDQPYGQCGCGGTDLEWLAGHELKIIELEVG